MTHKVEQIQKVSEVSIGKVPHWEIQYADHTVTIPINSNDANMETLGNLCRMIMEFQDHMKLLHSDYAG